MILVAADHNLPSMQADMLIADKAFYAEAGRRAARRRNDCRDPAQGNPATALGAEGSRRPQALA